MKNRYLRYIFLAGTVIGLVALAYLLYSYFEPAADISKQKTDLQVTDETLLSEFEDNHEQAALKYQNKVLEIQGSVVKVESDSNFAKLIFDKQGKFIVVASFVQKAQKEAASLKQNDIVHVKGIYTGYVINDEAFLIPGEIKIDQCTIAK